MFEALFILVWKLVGICFGLVFVFGFIYLIGVIIREMLDSFRYRR